MEKSISLITTKFLDSHNDYIEVYVKDMGNDQFIITDDGYNISDLRLNGYLFDCDEHNRKLQMIVDDFGVKYDRNELSINAKSFDLEVKKDSLVQAIIVINGFFYYFGR